MKKLILIFCFSLFYQIYGQAPKDTLFTLEGKALAGEYVRIDQKSIYFKIDGSKNVSTLPKDKIDKVLLKTGILLTASALPLIAKEDASGLTLEKDGEQVLIPLGEGVAVSSAYDPSNTVRGIYLGMTVDALRIQEKGESFEREIPMDEIGSIVTGKTKSTRDYVFQGMRIACIGTMGGVLLLGIIEPSDNSNFFGLGRGFMYALAGIYTSIFTVPAGALIGYINGQAAQGNTVEYVIGDGEWVIVK
jgi:outer membrane lipoprotein SlyB